LNEVTDSLVPTSGPFTLLEIGCGSGVYLFRALRRNPDLKAVGVEVQPRVAESLRAQADVQHLSDRVKIVQADVRTLEFKEAFDLITLHNNIYYFPEAERVAFLRQLLSWLRPAGRIAISSACPGGGVFSSYMRLWAAMTAGAGPLPDVRVFTRQLEDAGLVAVRCDKPVLFDSYRVFTWTRPARGLMEGGLGPS
jgi:cyclopropane fatty-acyl-phospholipid synthase-like methyltransferase